MKTIPNITIAGAGLLLLGAAAYVEGQQNPPAPKPAQPRPSINAPQGEPVIRQTRQVVVTNLSLRAATAIVAGKPEVRLRWSFASGWLPPFGYRLYRIQGEDRKQIYQSNPDVKPVVEAGPARLPAPNLSDLRLGKTGLLRLRSLPGGSDLEKLLALAPTTPRGVNDQAVIIGDAAPARPPSSAAVFNALKAAGQQTRAAGGPAPTPTETLQKAEDSAIVQQYLQKTRKLPVERAAPTEQDQVRSARATLLTAAMSSREVAFALGLGFDDKEVVAGQTYHYALHIVNPDGTDSPEPAGSIANFVVGRDPQPASPTGVAARQSAESAVELRWDRLTRQEELPLIMATYNIYRVTAATPNGVRINDKPVAVGTIKTAEGDVEPVSFFRDSSAAPGQITYRVTVVDAYGRESAPASLAFNVEDWRVPAPVSLVRGGNWKGQNSVIWLTDGVPGLKYRVFREDAEQKAPPQLLTPQPVDGTPLQPASAEEMKALMDFLGVPTAGAAPPTLLQIGNQAVVARGPRVFIDPTAQKDHYYVYHVTAVLPANGRDSQVAKSQPVGIPSDVAPPAVIGLKATFTAGPNNSRSLQYARATQPVMRTSQVRAREIAQDRGLATSVRTVNTAPPDIGGGMSVTWNPVPGLAQVTYRVLRAQAGGRSTPMSADQFAAVGQVTGVGAYTDQVPRSASIEYIYRVVPVSRWGVAGQPADFTIKVPSMYPPSVPSLVGVMPDRQGRIQIRLRANAPAEEVVRYRVFRKAVSPQAAAEAKPAWEDNLVAQSGRPQAPPAAQPQPAPVQPAPAAGAPRPVELPKQPVKPELESVVEELRLKPALAARFKRFRTRSLPNPREIPEAEEGYAEIPATPAGPADAEGRLTLLDSSAQPGSQYYYKVAAQNASGLLSSKCEPLGASPLKAALAAPTAVAAIAGAKGVEVKWTSPAGAVGFIVRRASGASTTFVQVSGVLKASPFVDTSALRGRTYRYDVMAIDASGDVSDPGLSAPVVAPK